MEKRNYRIIKLFVKGTTYENIGLEFNLCKERVRQIINAHLEPYQVKEILKQNRAMRKSPCFKNRGVV